MRIATALRRPLLVALVCASTAAEAGFQLFTDKAFAGVVSDGAALASLSVSPGFAPPGLPVVNNLMLAVPEAGTLAQSTVGLALLGWIVGSSRRRRGSDVGFAERSQTKRLTV